MKKYFMSLLLAAICPAIYVPIDTIAQEHFILDLWQEDEAPGDNGFTEVSSPGVFEMVSNAELWVFLPEPSIATGQAVLICPGGGYWGLAFEHEGIKPAKWLNEQGIAGIVLKYRMPNGNPAIPESDVFQAVKLVKGKARDWNIDPLKLGIMGSSAGGHLASLASTHFRSPEERPAFSILVYPVISMGRTGHRGSMENLLGKNPDNRAVETYSNELHVSPQAPPAFIVFSDDDPVVDPRNGTLYYDALKVNGVPAELHIYPTGGHGWGMSDTFEYIDEYKTSLSRWLSKQR